MYLSRFAVMLALAWTAACAPDARTDLQAELAALRAAATAYHEAASAKDAAAVVAAYDVHALMVPPAGALVEGSEAVRNYRFGFIESPGVDLEFDLIRAEVSRSGDIGWTLAIGEITVHSPDGPPTHQTVRDLHTWTRASDGSWRVVVDIWNSGPGV